MTYIAIQKHKFDSEPKQCSEVVVPNLTSPGNAKHIQPCGTQQLPLHDYFQIYLQFPWEEAGQRPRWLIQECVEIPSVWGSSLSACQWPFGF
eukprot:TRINITY_DN68687_c0_g1_i1.p1 TRINITY_DN68687_c0_g1~~TRINITY_DN68687_c0_g1_i1.p1  ORF type:complete len:108 (+),score=2.75 TRINITY_DN68687_c0_g1_i1:50-325(+)